MLDNRLQMIYDMIPCTELMCDIGTDHGKLPVHCVKQGKTDRALACDLRRGPLSSCQKLVVKEGLTEKIDTLLSDGFVSIPDEVFEKVGCFVLAGMGGELIMKILIDRHCNSFMILQPQSAVHELVEFLLTNGYDIITRRFCKDGDKLYTAMLVKYDGTVRQTNLFYGCEKSDVYYEYLNHELKKCEISLNGLLLAKNADMTRIEYINRIKTAVIGELRHESN